MYCTTCNRAKIIEGVKCPHCDLNPKEIKCWHCGQVLDKENCKNSLVAGMGVVCNYCGKDLIGFYLRKEVQFEVPGLGQSSPRSGRGSRNSRV